ncbi:hypothetical protein [Hymenobacter cellulosilyticus]|uniref:hypothetical protein n=1 Tax=Hymenobacter cellulosilyticus TaxID=2932248 RepID=UPI0028805963|nr:hypothetical protein [Hymenobacter cellulosilyticus]
MLPYPAPRPWILPVIVLAQFAGTSLWFAGNSVLPELLRNPRLSGASLGGVVSAVQLGFIVGTLVFALLSLADRVPPARLFLLSALAGSAANLGLLLPGLSAAGLLGLRFGTGLCLAGIYPVGMKIAADYYAGAWVRRWAFWWAPWCWARLCPRPALARGRAAVGGGGPGHVGFGGRWGRTAVAAGTQRSVSATRQPAAAECGARHLAARAVPGRGLRVFRAHVGAVHFLGLRAIFAGWV